MISPCQVKLSTGKNFRKPSQTTTSYQNIADGRDKHSACPLQAGWMQAAPHSWNFLCSSKGPERCCGFLEERGVSVRREEQRDRLRARPHPRCVGGTRAADSSEQPQVAPFGPC